MIPIETDEMIADEETVEQMVTMYKAIEKYLRQQGYDLESIHLAK